MPTVEYKVVSTCMNTWWAREWVADKVCFMFLIVNTARQY